MGLKQRVFPVFLLMLGLTAALIGRVCAVEASDVIAGIPVVGAAGVSETLEEIMQRMARLEESGALETTVDDMEKELEQPDRTGLRLPPDRLGRPAAAGRLLLPRPDHSRRLQLRGRDQGRRGR